MSGSGLIQPFRNCLELLAEGEVDEEVDRGVEHESQVVEAGEAEDPQGRRLLFAVAAI